MYVIESRLSVPKTWRYFWSKLKSKGGKKYDLTNQFVLKRRRSRNGSNFHHCIVPTVARTLVCVWHACEVRRSSLGRGGLRRLRKGSSEYKTPWKTTGKARRKYNSSITTTVPYTLFLDTGPYTTQSEPTWTGFISKQMYAVVVHRSVVRSSPFINIIVGISCVCFLYDFIHFPRYILKTSYFYFLCHDLRKYFESFKFEL